MLEQYKLSVFKQGMDSYEILNLKKKKKERKDFVFPWNGIIKHKKKKKDVFKILLILYSEWTK